MACILGNEVRYGELFAPLKKVQQRSVLPSKYSFFKRCNDS